MRGVLVFGTSADYPPFEFHILDENGQDKIVGIDVAVAQKVAEDMGCELKIVDISFENLLTNIYSSFRDGLQYNSNNIHCQ